MHCDRRAAGSGRQPLPALADSDYDGQGTVPVTSVQSQFEELEFPGGIPLKNHDSDDQCAARPSPRYKARARSGWSMILARARDNGGKCLCVRNPGGNATLYRFRKM